MTTTKHLGALALVALAACSDNDRASRPTAPATHPAPLEGARIDGVISTTVTLATPTGPRVALRSSASAYAVVGRTGAQWTASAPTAQAGARLFTIEEGPPSATASAVRARSKNQLRSVVREGHRYTTAIQKNDAGLPKKVYEFVDDSILSVTSYGYTRVEGGWIRNRVKTTAYRGGKPAIDIDYRLDNAVVAEGSAVSNAARSARVLLARGLNEVKCAVLPKALFAQSDGTLPCAGEYADLAFRIALLAQATSNLMFAEAACGVAPVIGCVYFLTQLTAWFGARELVSIAHKRLDDCRKRASAESESTSDGQWTYDSDGASTGGSGDLHLQEEEDRLLRVVEEFIANASKVTCDLDSCLWEA